MNDWSQSLIERLRSGPFFLIRHYLELAKIHLCIYIGLAAMLGHVSGQGTPSAETLLVGAGVLILASGSAVLNNVQDRGYDRAFVRTAGRVLPTGRVRVSHARRFSLVLTAAGLGVLIVCGSVSCFLIGVLAAVMYNGVYTTLKKRTLWAMGPGILSGVLPVWIGWAGSGQPLFSFHPLMLMAVLGLWQVPHFLVVALQADRRSASPFFPVISDLLDSREIRLQAVLWASLYGMGIIVFLLAGSAAISIAAMICGLNALLTPAVLGVLLFGPQVKPSAAFAAVNLSMLIFLGTRLLHTLFN